MIGVVGAIVVAFFWALIGGLKTSSMSTLYADLDPSSAAAIAAQLEAEQIPYESNATGRLIRVPSNQVDKLRLRFAGEGLSGGVVGKEIFDGESSFGRTSFELNINYVRAIEGELSRTIKYIRAITEARVHVVMPERRPFQREEGRPSAAIMLKTAGAITQQQARSIQALVASAVPGLSPESVTISDTSGRLIMDGSAESEHAAFSNLEEIRLTSERTYRNRIEDLIGSVVGRGLVRAEVSVVMDMNRTTTSQTTFDPDTQVVVSSNVTEENSSEAVTGGQVTAAANLPDAQGGPNGTGGNDSSKTNEVTNFENSKTETMVVKEPGEVTQIRVSLLVDHNRVLDEDGNTVGTPTPRTDDELAQIEGLVKTAIPFDENRGDEVTVVTMRFVDPAPIEAAPEAFNFLGLNKQDIIEILKSGGSVVLAIIVILLIVRPLVARVIEAIPDAPPPLDPNQVIEDRTPEIPAIAAPGSSLSAEVLAAAAAGDEEAAAAVLAARDSGSLVSGQMRADTKIDVAQVEGRLQESAVKKVAEIIRSNPEESVAIVRSWLYAE
ncbi:MAG: flagellar M-ring protein FliF [Kordiimonadaceae bacterium]|nr:flagellar M-ring protein FliF [Kordiimonadaceae bacterium]